MRKKKKKKNCCTHEATKRRRRGRHNKKDGGGGKETNKGENCTFSYLPYHTGWKGNTPPGMSFRPGFLQNMGGTLNKKWFWKYFVEKVA